MRQVGAAAQIKRVSPLAQSGSGFPVYHLHTFPRIGNSRKSSFQAGLALITQYSVASLPQLTYLSSFRPAPTNSCHFRSVEPASRGELGWVRGLCSVPLYRISAICGPNSSSQYKPEAGRHNGIREVAASGAHSGSGGVEAKPVRVAAERAGRGPNDVGNPNPVRRRLPLTGPKRAAYGPALRSFASCPPLPVGLSWRSDQDRRNRARH